MFLGLRLFSHLHFMETREERLPSFIANGVWLPWTWRSTYDAKPLPSSLNTRTKWTNHTQLETHFDAMNPRTRNVAPRYFKRVSAPAPTARLRKRAVQEAPNVLGAGLAH